MNLRKQIIKKGKKARENLKNMEPWFQILGVDKDGLEYWRYGNSIFVSDGKESRFICRKVHWDEFARQRNVRPKEGKV